MGYIHLDKSLQPVQTYSRRREIEQKFPSLYRCLNPALFQTAFEVQHCSKPQGLQSQANTNFFFFSLPLPFSPPKSSLPLFLSLSFSRSKSNVREWQIAPVLTHCIMKGRLVKCLLKPQACGNSGMAREAEGGKQQGIFSEANEGSQLFLLSQLQVIRGGECVMLLVRRQNLTVIRQLVFSCKQSNVIQQKHYARPD